MRFAVVFKTYQWDPFVQRQALRLQEASAGGDFIVSIDETNGTVGPVPFPLVVRTCNAEIVALGFPDRFERGSLLWWNPDYVHYQVQARHPEYDYYVFVEYDAVVRLDVATIVHRMATDGIDVVSLPLPMPKQDWYWTIYHRQVYALAELEGALICVTAFSRRALQILAARRREMGVGTVSPFWPNAEVFIPTEATRARLRMASLAGFGAVDKFRWFPPTLEDDLWQDEPAFLHPVLDRDRYISAILKSTATFRAFLYPRSKTWRALSRFPPQDYLPRLLPAAFRRFRRSLRDRIERWRLATRITG